MILLTILLLFPHGPLGFLLSDPCPSESPCRCYGRTISCVRQHLNVFPTFKFEASSRGQYREMTIDLAQNLFTAVPINALGNVNDVQPNKLIISLNKNNISRIDDHAFSNLGNISVGLDLSENNLNRLPNALKYIQNLQTLHILDNSLLFLDGTILNSIGKSLETLWIDMSSVPIWPREFNAFGKLQELHADKIPFVSLPRNSFDGMTSLRRLQISNSKLHAVPEAICSLTSLQHLDFNHNTNLHSLHQTVVPDCQSPLSSVTLVYLNNDNLFTFPNNIFNVFPMLTSLGLNYNNLEGIDESAVPNNVPLYYLYLSNNKLQQIPPVVSKLKGLYTLVVSYNMITSVDAYVLSTLHHLRQLTISYNPLTYIDPHAFNTDYTMDSFYMENTNLTSVPVAILHSANRFSVQLHGSPIQCTCTNMAFLLSIPKDEIQSGKKFFRGDCVNLQMSLKSYIMNDLPACLN